MGTQVKVLRRKAFYGAGAICRIEIDGVVVGQVRNGENVSVSVNEGKHRICFVATNGTLSGKVLQRADFTAVDGKDIVIEIQFNSSNGQLDIFSADVVYENTKKHEPRYLVSLFLFAIAGLLCVATLIVCIVFSDDLKGGNTVNTPTISTPITPSPQIQYEKVDLQTMLDDLEINALRAEETYQDMYVEITGEVRNFDSDGKYISIVPSGASDWCFDWVQCYLTDPAHKTFLLGKNVGDVVTIKGKVSSIGEIIGYHVDIAEISD